MKTYKCPYTGNEVNYQPTSIFRVYVRRSNCKKRLSHIGQDVEKAMDAYNKIRIYQNDRKYFHVDNEVSLRANGFLTRDHNLTGTKNVLNYQYKPFHVPRIPITIMHSLSGYSGKVIDNGNYPLSVTRIVLLLLARASEMQESELFALLEESLTPLRKQMLLSGCDNSEELAEILQSDELL
jgi:hypothetical protein